MHAIANWRRPQFIYRILKRDLSAKRVMDRDPLAFYTDDESMAICAQL